MAGTVLFTVYAGHTFQRKFDSSALSNALRGSHLYIVSRRPRTRLEIDSLGMQRGRISFSIKIAGEQATDLHNLTLDLSRDEPPTGLQAHLDGSYFSFKQGEKLIHGDAWSLASLASGLDLRIAKQEILYIGQAFGQQGERTAFARLRNHEKLQQIYADHAGENWDVFLTPVFTGQILFISDDHIDDNEDGPELEIYHEKLVDLLSGKPLRSAIDLIEHSLISYFKPKYNIQLLAWRPDAPTRAMTDLRLIGLRLIAVEFSCAERLVRFYTATQTQMWRSHMILHDLPARGKARRSELRQVNADRMSSWRIGGFLFRHGPTMLADSSELSGAILEVFGDAAPEIRRPPEVDLSQYGEAGASRGPTKRDSWTSAVNDPEPLTAHERQHLTRPFPIWSAPTYEQSGSIRVRSSDMDPVERWLVHTPNRVYMSNGLIIGASYAAFMMAQQVVYELVRSQVVRVAVMLDDTGNLDGLLRSWGGASCGNARTIGETAELLADLLLATLLKRASGSVGRISLGNPGTVLVIHDTKSLLLNHDAASLCLAILQLGPASGVSVVAICDSPEILEVPSELGRALVKSGNLAVAGMDTDVAHATFHRLNYYQNPVRSRSLEGSEAEFVTWFNEYGAGVGQAVAFNSDARTAAEALVWVHYVLTTNTTSSSAGRQLISIPQRGTAWSAMDAAHGLRWAVLEQDHGWLLVQQYARISGKHDQDDVLGSSLLWASGHLSRSLTGVEISWTSGPSATGDTTVAYFSVQREVKWSDRAGAWLWRLVGDRAIPYT